VALTWKEERGEDAGERAHGGQPDGRSESADQEAAARHAADVRWRDSRRARCECRTHDAVDADGCQQERDRGEDADEHGVEAAMGEGSVDDLVHGEGTINGLLGIGGAMAATVGAIHWAGSPAVRTTRAMRSWVRWRWGQ
jgi:hypothetical protein